MAKKISELDPSAALTGAELVEVVQSGSSKRSTVAEIRGANLQCIPVACGDETTALTAGSAKVTFHMPYDFTLTEVMAGLTTPQTGGAILTVDVNEAGVSLFTTRLTIDNGEETSLTAAAPAVLTDTTLAKGAKITIDIDQIGDSTAKGLKVYLIGVKA